VEVQAPQEHQEQQDYSHFHFKYMDKTLDQKYDEIVLTELQRRLKREPTPNEIINGDNDSDLNAEIYWQLIKDLEERIKVLETERIVV